MGIAKLHGGRRVKGAAKRRETTEIRAFVFRRANHICEACRNAPATDLEHTAGRIRAHQSIFNTIALCRQCHRDATDNHPSKVAWLWIQLRIFTLHGYDEQIAMTKAAIQFHTIKAQLPFAPSRGAS